MLIAGSVLLIVHVSSIVSNVLYCIALLSIVKFIIKENIEKKLQLLER